MAAIKMLHAMQVEMQAAMESLEQQLATVQAEQCALADKLEVMAGLRPTLLVPLSAEVPDLAPPSASAPMEEEVPNLASFFTSCHDELDEPAPPAPLPSPTLQPPPAPAATAAVTAPLPSPTLQPPPAPVATAAVAAPLLSPTLQPPQAPVATTAVTTSVLAHHSCVRDSSNKSASSAPPSPCHQDVRDLVTVPCQPCSFAPRGHAADLRCLHVLLSCSYHAVQLPSQPHPPDPAAKLADGFLRVTADSSRTSCLVRRDEVLWALGPLDSNQGTVHTVL